MKKAILGSGLAFLLLVLSSAPALAQKYNIAVGWRAGVMTNGLTIKAVPIDGIALEGIVGFYPYGPSATLMLEKHTPVFCIRALQLYAGIGGHYRFNYNNASGFNPVFHGDTNPVYAERGFGVDAIAGLELKLPFIPLAISADVKPNVEFVSNGTMFYGLDPGVGLKLAF